MAKRRAVVTIGTLGLERASSVPLHRQLYDALRDADAVGPPRGPGRACLDARDGGGARRLAQHGHGGVRASCSPRATRGPRRRRHVRHAHAAGRRAARRAARPATRAPGPRAISAPRRPARRDSRSRAARSAPPAFRPGVPALDAFPFEMWARLVARRWRRAAARPARLRRSGRLPAAARGRSPTIWPSARGVALRRGAGRSSSPARSRRSISRRACCSIPATRSGSRIRAIRGARAALLARRRAAGAGAGRRRGPRRRRRAPGASRRAAMAYVSPSHQYPLGVTMSLTRRLALLEWARAAGAWVLEDDYDSEYRYAGRPLAALQGLDARRPRDLHGHVQQGACFRRCGSATWWCRRTWSTRSSRPRAVADRHSPPIDQAALADFIGEGHWRAHIRRMRVLYAERQACSDRGRAEPSRRPPDARARRPPACIWSAGWQPAWTTARSRSRRPLPGSRRLPSPATIGSGRLVPRIGAD